MYSIKMATLTYLWNTPQGSELLRNANLIRENVLPTAHTLQALYTTHVIELNNGVLQSSISAFKIVNGFAVAVWEEVQKSFTVNVGINIMPVLLSHQDNEDDFDKNNDENADQHQQSQTDEGNGPDWNRQLDWRASCWQQQINIMTHHVAIRCIYNYNITVQRVIFVG